LGSRTQVITHMSGPILPNMDLIGTIVQSTQEFECNDLSPLPVLNFFSRWLSDEWNQQIKSTISASIRFIQFISGSITSSLKPLSPETYIHSVLVKYGIDSVTISLASKDFEKNFDSKSENISDARSDDLLNHDINVNNPDNHLEKEYTKILYQIAKSLSNLLQPMHRADSVYIPISNDQYIPWTVCLLMVVLPLLLVVLVSLRKIACETRLPGSISKDRYSSCSPPSLPVILYSLGYISIHLIASWMKLHIFGSYNFVIVLASFFALSSINFFICHSTKSEPAVSFLIHASLIISIAILAIDNIGLGIFCAWTASLLSTSRQYVFRVLFSFFGWITLSSYYCSINEKKDVLPTIIGGLFAVYSSCI
jgi:hypothetical protein